MPEPGHDFTATEIKAGAFVLAAVAVLVLFVAAIRGCPVGDERAAVYYATFTDVGGLGKGAPVRFGGLEVGRVEAVELDPGDRNQIRVAARVVGDVPVNADSVASITQVSLTSEKHFEISVGDGSAEELEDGATIPSTGVAGGLFDIPDVEGVILRIENLLDDIIRLVGVDRMGSDGGADQIVNLSQLVAGLDELLREVTTAVRDVRGWLEQDPGGAREVVEKLIRLEEVATEMLLEVRGAVADARAPLTETADNLARLSGRAAEIMEELSADLSSTLGRLEAAGATADDLLADQRPEIEEIVDNLERTTRNLRELSRRLADDPSVLIRGGAPDGRMRGEDR